MISLSDEADETRFAYVSAYVKQLDPSATDAAIRRYLAEIETMAAALKSLDFADEPHLAPFTPGWPTGEPA